MWMERWWQIYIYLRHSLFFYVFFWGSFIFSWLILRQGRDLIPLTCNTGVGVSHRTVCELRLRSDWIWSESEKDFSDLSRYLRQPLLGRASPRAKSWCVLSVSLQEVQGSTTRVRGSRRTSCVTSVPSRLTPSQTARRSEPMSSARGRRESLNQDFPSDAERVCVSFTFPCDFFDRHAVGKYVTSPEK